MTHIIGASTALRAIFGSVEFFAIFAFVCIMTWVWAFSALRRRRKTSDTESSSSRSPCSSSSSVSSGSVSSDISMTDDEDEIESVAEEDLEVESEEEENVELPQDDTVEEEEAGFEEDEEVVEDYNDNFNEEVVEEENVIVEKSDNIHKDMMNFDEEMSLREQRQEKMKREIDELRLQLEELSESFSEVREIRLSLENPPTLEEEEESQNANYKETPREKNLEIEELSVPKQSVDKSSPDHRRTHSVTSVQSTDEANRPLMRSQIAQTRRGNWVTSLRSPSEDQSPRSRQLFDPKKAEVRTIIRSKIEEETRRRIQMESPGAAPKFEEGLRNYGRKRASSMITPMKKDIAARLMQPLGQRRVISGMKKNAFEGAGGSYLKSGVPYSHIHDSTASDNDLRDQIHATITKARAVINSISERRARRRENEVSATHADFLAEPSSEPVSLIPMYRLEPRSFSDDEVDGFRHEISSVRDDVHNLVQSLQLEESELQRTLGKLDTQLGSDRDNKQKL